MAIFALLQSEKVKLPYYERLKRAFDPNRAVTVREIPIGPLKAVEITISLDENTMRKSLYRVYIAAMEKLERIGAKRILYRDDFKDGGIFTEDGFIPIDDHTLWDIKCADIARLASKGERAVFISENPKEDDFLHIQRLGEKFRYVHLLSSPSMGYQCRLMCQKTGISVIERPSDERMKMCDAAVVKRNCLPARLARDCTVVSYGAMPDKIEGAKRYVKEIEVIAPAVKKECVPNGYSMSAIVSECMRQGKTDDGAIIIKNVKISRKNDK